MTFVGTRPETPKYVAQYSPEMWATLLLPAGVTSEASIRYKDEERLLKEAENPDSVYIETILPVKMWYNLKSIREIRIFHEFMTMLRTLLAVLGKDYADEQLPEESDVFRSEVSIHP